MSPTFDTCTLKSQFDMLALNTCRRRFAAVFFFLGALSSLPAQLELVGILSLFGFAALTWEAGILALGPYTLNGIVFHLTT